MSELCPTGSKYSDDQRMQAAVLYAVHGVGSIVSREMNIPETTISNWRKQDWWDTAIAEVRSEKQDYYIAKYGELIEEGTRVALEKLPEASARDAMIIAATANDKMRLALNQPTSISGKAEGMGELMAKFEKIERDHQNIKNSVVSEQ